MCICNTITEYNQLDQVLLPCQMLGQPIDDFLEVTTLLPPVVKGDNISVLY